eukprot:6888452-Pyramimonas_sp.AAC.1
MWPSGSRIAPIRILTEVPRVMRPWRRQEPRQRQLISQSQGLSSSQAHLLALIRPRKKERKSPDDLSPGGSKQQRYAGQPADRQRPIGPAVAVAAARFQGTSAPAPKEPVPRRGPAPGRARSPGWAPALEGRTRDASST